MSWVQNDSKKLLSYSWILNMLSLGDSSVFSWHSKAQRQNYSLFSLKDNNRPTQVLDIYLETSGLVLFSDQDRMLIAMS